MHRMVFISIIKNIQSGAAWMYNHNKSHFFSSTLTGVWLPCILKNIVKRRKQKSGCATSLNFATCEGWFQTTLTHMLMLILITCVYEI